MEHHPSEMEEYIQKHIDAEPELLQKLNRETHSSILFPRMISGHIQGRLLAMLCQMIQPQRVLEIGTFTGYSALCMAEALPENACIDTCEINDELEEFIMRFIDMSSYKAKINLHIGDALHIIPKLNFTYDLVFIDGNKRLYVDYYKTVFDKLNPGAYILADNTLWDGKVLKPLDEHDLQSIGIVNFNKLIAQDERVEKVILPLRDGLTIIRKK